MALDTKINRLIIIGNGFDLAHGLPTKYEDFILDYLVKCFNSFYEKGVHNDELIQLRIRDDMYFFNDEKNKIETKETILHSLSEKSQLAGNYVVKFKSKVLEKSLENLQIKQWIDFEKEYFSVLKLAANSYESEEFSVELVNKQLEFLKGHFISYLKSLDYDQNSYIPKFNIPFFENVSKDEVVTMNLKEVTPVQNVCFLNFNYTPLLSNVYNVATSSKGELIHIHGDIHQKDGDCIFGFGDELDDEYLKFEKMNNNKLFTHIKSFEYSQHENYSKMLRFIGSEVFQVHIYGHSCGLSDRTLLNHISNTKTVNQ